MQPESIPDIHLRAAAKQRNKDMSIERYPSTSCNERLLGVESMT